MKAALALILAQKRRHWLPSFWVKRCFPVGCVAMKWLTTSLSGSPTEQHFADVVLSEEFLNLGIEQVCSLISSDKLTISSEEKASDLFPFASSLPSTIFSPLPSVVLGSFLSFCFFRGGLCVCVCQETCIEQRTWCCPCWVRSLTSLELSSRLG